MIFRNHHTIQNVILKDGVRNSFYTKLDKDRTEIVVKCVD